MLPYLWGQADFSPKKWLKSTGLGKATKSEGGSNPKSSCLDPLTWCRNMVF